MPSKKRSSGSNWLSLKSKLDEECNNPPGKRKRTDLSEAAASRDKGDKADAGPSQDPKKAVSEEEKAQYVGLDCEMVGIGSSGKRSVLARACLVNFDGEVIYDSYVRPKEFVTDFRTKYSGIRKHNFRKDEGAITLLECQRDVAALLKDKVLVGHALKNDLDVLLLSHRRSMIRDTATYPPYMRPHPKKQGKYKPRALRDLTKQFLGYSIQEGEHDPGEDARAAMNLYAHKRDEWEGSIKDHSRENARKAKAGMKKSREKTKERVSGKTPRRGSMFGS